MESLWNDLEAQANTSDIGLRAYSSRLLGRESALVLHGGGNTSVKSKYRNLFGEEIDVLYVKGSGWDLQTILPQGFAPVRMDVLLKLARLNKLSDSDMVREQKTATLDPSAPVPSVEAILHAIIPFKFVEHTHADAVVAITNTPGGESKIKEVYGSRVLYVPYVMPGFVLAQKIFELTRDIQWDKLEGMILLNHGVFTFSNDAKSSYEKMIQLVSEAESYLASKGAFKTASAGAKVLDPVHLARLRKEVSKVSGGPLVVAVDTTEQAAGFSNLKNVKELATRGTLTPDHVIHTKPKPMLISEDCKKDLESYVDDYKKYFSANNGGDLVMLNPAPRWAVWPGIGTVAFGTSKKMARIVGDISRSTVRAIQWSEALGGWKPLESSKLFEVEYWELEQAKIKKSSSAPEYQGKIALVTGAASGIGKAVVEKLLSSGGNVIGLDIDPKVEESFKSESFLGIVCDVTNSDVLKRAVDEGVRKFGGIDILVSNAGMFPAGRTLDELPDSDWDKSIAINLTSHERLIKTCLPYLKFGIDSSIVIIASKNVAAPGPGAAAYSVAKAGLTQLARVAAIELAKENIRVNVLHPDAVFDTGIWTPEILENRARHYGITVEQYKRKNLLRTEVTSANVAELVCAVASHVFSKTTGAQIPIDGGNERVI